ncbi:MAG: hypothetical protein ACO1TE_27635 [Prosthecobacter sp.]
MRLLSCLALFLAAAVTFAPAADPVLELEAINGQKHAPLVVTGEKKAAVLFFVSPFCSTTKAFMKEINAIAADYVGKAAVYVVHSDPEITKEVAMEHAVISEVKDTTTVVLLDKEQTLAKQVQAKITPEAVVVGSDGKTLYKGRINDLYLGPTKRQRAATTKDLRDALDAILAGKPVAEPQLEAQGCKIGGIK